MVEQKWVVETARDPYRKGLFLVVHSLWRIVDNCEGEPRIFGSPESAQARADQLNGDGK